MSWSDLRVRDLFEAELDDVNELVAASPEGRVYAMPRFS